MSAPSYPSPASAKSKDSSYSYAQRLRAERIYGLIGSREYPALTSVDTAVLLALNYYSKQDGTGMRPSTETLALMTNLSRSSVLRSLSRLLKGALLKLDGAQRSRGVVVSYRFGDALLKPSGSRLRDHLAEKRMVRELMIAAAKTQPDGAAASVAVTRTSVRGTPVLTRELVTVTPDLLQGDAAPVSEGRPTSVTKPRTSVTLPHRTNLELIPEPKKEPIQDLMTDAVGTSRPLAGAAHRLAHPTAESVEDTPDTTTVKIPTTDDEIRAFFEMALSE